MKLLKVLPCVMCISLLLGCSNENIISESNDNISMKTESFPISYQKTDGKVTFDGEISYSAIDNLCTCNAKMKKINKQGEEIFLNQEDDYEEYNDDVLDEFGNTKSSTTYMNSYNGFYLSPGNYSSNLYYTRGNSYYYNICSAFRMQKKFNDYNADKFSTEKSLAFMNQNDAFDQINNTLNQLGMGADYEYVCYALDCEKMKQEEIHYDMNGNVDTSENKGAWTEADDTYYFAIRQTYNKTPVYYPYVNTFVEEEIENYPINCLIDKDGIISLNIDQIFTFSDAVAVEEIASFDDVFDSVSAKYNDILGDSSYAFDSAELTYYVDLSSQDGEYKVYPIWIIKGNEIANGTYSPIQVCVDVQTGNEVIPWTEDIN